MCDYEKRGNMNKTISGGEKRGMRLDKLIASEGISRQEAKKLIAGGRVTVDGKTIKNPGFSVTEENEISVDAIKNDLLDNLSENINISHSPVSNGSKFNTFTVAFGALEDLKTGLTDFYDLVDGKALNDIGTITGQIDETLETNQENILYGVVTTRKLALLITNEVLELFELLDSNDYSSKGYLEDLQSYYTNNLNSLTKESYNSTTSSIDDYDTPFQTYHTKYQEDLANLGL